MLFNFFNELYHERDGALQASNMRFLLPIPEGKGTTLTRRAAAILISVAILAITFLTIGTAFLGDEQPHRLHDHMKPIAESIGNPQDAVFEALSDSGMGLIQITTDTFVVPDGCVISDAEFGVLLHFEQNEGLLDGFAYVTRTKVPPKEAARILKEVLSTYYNDSVTLENGKEISLQTKILTELLSGTEPVAFRDSVDVTPDPASGTAVAKYIENLQAADYWEGRLREYLIKTANYYRDIEVNYTPQSQVLEIRLSYQIEADRG